MKNIFWTILAVALSACSEPYRGFVLDGKIQGADNELLYLYYTDSLGVWSKDSVAVKEGKFSFRGGITEPTTASLCLGGEGAGAAKRTHNERVAAVDPGILCRERS